jgi:hypothetical protein
MLGVGLVGDQGVADFGDASGIEAEDVVQIALDAAVLEVHVGGHVVDVAVGAAGVGFVEARGPDLGDAVGGLGLELRVGAHVVGGDSVRGDDAGEQQEEQDDEARAVLALGAVDDGGIGGGVGEDSEQLAQFGGAVLQGVLAQADEPARVDDLAAENADGV